MILWTWIVISTRYFVFLIIIVEVSFFTCFQNFFNKIILTLLLKRSLKTSVGDSFTVISMWYVILSDTNALPIYKKNFFYTTTCNDEYTFIKETVYNTVSFLLTFWSTVLRFPRSGQVEGVTDPTLGWTGLRE